MYSYIIGGSSFNTVFGLNEMTTTMMTATATRPKNKNSSVEVKGRINVKQKEQELNENQNKRTSQRSKIKYNERRVTYCHPRGDSELHLYISPLFDFTSKFFRVVLAARGE